MCEDCKKIAEITRIQSSDDIVRFYLQCKICGKAGIRKIYVMHELPFLEMSGSGKKSKKKKQITLFLLFCEMLLTLFTLITI